VGRVLAFVENGDIDSAIKAGRNSQDFVVRTLVYALDHRDRSVSEALLRAANVELNRFNRGINILDTVITMAPLLGLLGTVTGMIHSFGLLGASELGAPAAITGGMPRRSSRPPLALRCHPGAAAVQLSEFAARERAARNSGRRLASGALPGEDAAELRISDHGGSGSMNVPSPRSGKKARIEIIPLIDIVFFLLATFVMVSMAMIKNQGVSVNLPVASTSAPQERKEYTAITVTAGATITSTKRP
jgi:hypothetical protein